MRQHTAGYPGKAGYGRIRQSTAGYSRIRQDAVGYNRIRQDTAGYAYYRNTVVLGKPHLVGEGVAPKGFGTKPGNAVFRPGRFKK